MKPLHCLILYLLIINVSSFAQETPVPVSVSKEVVLINGKKYNIHVVQKGQTLYSISKAYNTNVETIISENNLDASGALDSGQAIKIPIGIPVVKPQAVKPATYPPLADTNFIRHIVKANQTLYSLSREYSVPIETIIQYNPEIKQGMKKGQIVIIPRKYATTKPATHKHNIISFPAANKLPDTANTVLADTDTNNEQRLYTYEHKTVFADTNADTYNIALLFSFNITKNANTDSITIPGEDNIPETIYSVNNYLVEFYQGILAAMNNLRKRGVKVQLYVYDTRLSTGDEYNKKNLESILSLPEFASMNLVIGPVWPDEAIPVARYCKENKIPLVLPFTDNEKLLVENPYVIELLPSHNNEMENVARYIYENYSHYKVYTIYENDITQSNNLYELKDYANRYAAKMNKTDNVWVKDFVYNATRENHMRDLINDTSHYLFIVPSRNEGFIGKLLSELSLFREYYNVEVMTIPHIQLYKNTEIVLYHYTSVHFFSAFLVDYNSPLTIEFLMDYRNIYNTEPASVQSARGYNYSFYGYDIAYYFGNALHTYGKDILNHLDTYHCPLLLTEYHFTRTNAKSGWRNATTNIGFYTKDYNLVREKTLYNQTP